MCMWFSDSVPSVVCPSCAPGRRVPRYARRGGPQTGAPQGSAVVERPIPTDRAEAQQAAERLPTSRWRLRQPSSLEPCCSVSALRGCAWPFIGPWVVPEALSPPVGPLCTEPATRRRAAHRLRCFEPRSMSARQPSPQYRGLNAVASVPCAAEHPGRSEERR